MHIFWLNGNLVLEPENESEGEALEGLVDSVKWGRPKRSDPGMVPQPEPVSEKPAA